MATASVDLANRYISQGYRLATVRIDTVTEPRTLTLVNSNGWHGFSSEVRTVQDEDFVPVFELTMEENKGKAVRAVAFTTDSQEAARLQREGHRLETICSRGLWRHYVREVTTEWAGDTVSREEIGFSPTFAQGFIFVR